MRKRGQSTQRCLIQKEPEIFLTTTAVLQARRQHFDYLLYMYVCMCVYTVTSEEQKSMYITPNPFRVTVVYIPSLHSSTHTSIVYVCVCDLCFGRLFVRSIFKHLHANKHRREQKLSLCSLSHQIRQIDDDVVFFVVYLGAISGSCCLLNDAFKYFNIIFRIGAISEAEVKYLMTQGCHQLGISCRICNFFDTLKGKDS